MVALADNQEYCLCANSQFGVCNWVIKPENPHSAPFCLACSHNQLIPNLESEENRLNWKKLESAKKHLFYSLLNWGLPLEPSVQSPNERLVFRFAADVVSGNTTVEKILTGHDNGIITINLAEADDAVREQMRTAMNEPYRTVLGHFRHEVGHYYWDRLVRDTHREAECMAVFGDHEQDYAAALQHHYNNGSPSDWGDAYISSYATMHPWEDFAETWAHYIHIVDALETARSVGLHLKPPAKANEALETEIDFQPYKVGSVEELVSAWVPLTVAVNSINRSMGQPDLYPFVLSGPAVEKLKFIHQLIQSARNAPSLSHTARAL